MKHIRKSLTVLLLVLSVLLAGIVSRAETVYALPEGPDLMSQFAILQDPDTGQVLYEENADQRMYPASMTKVMTGILAIENLKDLDEEVTISQEMLYDLISRNASVAGYTPGMKATVRDLLYALLLPSGADAANALAIKTAGTLPKFAEMMNAKAAEIGMDHSHFENAHGLHEDSHYTTARDFLKLMNYARQNELFCEILATESYQGKLKEFKSIAWSQIGPGYVDFPGFQGGKTGFTGYAGLCFAFFAEKDGMKLTGVIAGCPGEYETYNHLRTAGKLAAWGFDNYRRYKAPEEPMLIGTVHVEHRFEEEDIPVYAKFEFENDILKGNDPAVAVQLPNHIQSTNSAQNITVYARLMSGDEVLEVREVTVTVPREPNFFVRFFRTFGKPLGILAGVLVIAAAVLIMRKKFYRRRRL